MTDIPMKNKKPYLRHSLPRVRFFIVNLFCLYATELTNIS